MDIITRQDGTQKVFLSENSIDVVEILQEFYHYIYESIQKEGFILKYDRCNLFKELVYDNKVVGFCSYDFSREFITAALNNIYVLPQFRGNKLLLKELKVTMQEHSKPSIMEPTRLVVELLIEYGFACRINDSIVASALEFIVPADHVLSNRGNVDEELSTHFYDLSVCGCIHILDLDNAHVAYSAPLNHDLINYENIDEVNGEYFIGLVCFFRMNEVELMEAMLDLEENLPVKNYTLEEVIGDDDNFSFYIESLIDDSHVTRSRAFEIKRQIREEYEAGMILNESLLIRLAYLFNQNTSLGISSHDDVCPYCGMPIDRHDVFCHFCGINLSYNPYEMQDSLIDTISTSASDFTEDIRFVAYKFLRLIEENIEFEYCIVTIENVYNVPWTELKRFLLSNSYFNEKGITREGYEFLNSHPLHFWQKFQMDVVDYTDFEEYFYNHPDSNPVDVCLNYLEKFDDDEDISEIISEIRNNN